ncbi:MAG: hypothetical protein ACLFTK_15960 [Anaerolineales bacterium]
MTNVERQPTDAEINAVLDAFDHISLYINLQDGRIIGTGWHEVREVLRTLSDYELWLGLCNLEQAVFDAQEEATPAQVTLFELFHMVYEQGLDAL